MVDAVSLAAVRWRPSNTRLDPLSVVTLSCPFVRFPCGDIHCISASCIMLMLRPTFIFSFVHWCLWMLTSLCSRCWCNCPDICIFNTLLSVIILWLLLICLVTDRLFSAYKCRCRKFAWDGAKSLRAGYKVTLEDIACSAAVCDSSSNLLSPVFSCSVISGRRSINKSMSEWFRHLLSRVLVSSLYSMFHL